VLRLAKTVLPAERVKLKKGGTKTAKKNIHPARYITGVHIRHEEVGDPIFMGAP